MVCLATWQTITCLPQRLLLLQLWLCLSPGQPCPGESQEGAVQRFPRVAQVWAQVWTCMGIRPLAAWRQAVQMGGMQRLWPLPRHYKPT